MRGYAAGKRKEDCKEILWTWRTWIYESCYYSTRFAWKYYGSATVQCKQRKMLNWKYWKCPVKVSGSVTSDGRDFKEVSQYVFQDAGFPVYLKSGIRDFKAKGRRDLGLKVWLHGTRDAQNNHRVYSATTLTVALGTRLSNHNCFWKRKDSQVERSGKFKRFLHFYIYHITSIPSLQGLYAQIRSGS